MENETQKQTEKQGGPRVAGYATAIVFAVFIFFFFFANIGGLGEKLGQDLPSVTPDNVREYEGGWEAAYREDFFLRDNLIDAAGLSMLGLDRKSVDNYNYMKDENGALQRFEGLPLDISAVADSIAEMDALCGEQGIPLLFAQIPARFQDTDLAASREIEFFGKRNDDLLSALDEKGIRILDIDQTLRRSGYAGQIALRTDGHLKTDVEFQSAKILAEVLLGLGVPYDEEIDYVFSTENYTIKSYPFRGFFTESSGRFFTRIDSFELYFPAYPTDFSMVVPATGLEERGTFHEVLMNGLEEQLDTNPRPYWILNYLRYPNSLYRISNHSTGGTCRLLVVMDSMAIRTTAFLSLGAAEITVVDPRYDETGDILRSELESGNFDAVILAGNCIPLFESLILPNGLA